MARTTEETPPEPRVQPNIDGIIALLLPGGELDEAAKKKQDGASAEGTIFQRIEKNLHGNRAAVSDIRRIRKWAKDKQADYIRTLEPLLVHFGLTLEAIDPEDLLERGNAKQTVVDPEAGDNTRVTELDAARQKLSGGDVVPSPSEAGAAPSAESIMAAANGSVQLRKFVGALRSGRTLDEAISISGMEPGEADLTLAAEQRGEFADLDVIQPAPKRGRPRLGIVAGAPETKQ